MDCVRAGVTVAFLEFFAGADACNIDDPVDGEDAVEMIDLMLQKLREISVIAGFKCESVAVEILITDTDLSMPFNLHEDREEAQARVPNHDFVVAARDDFRIDQRPGLDAREFEEDDTQRYSQLRSGNAASVAGCEPPLGERVGEIAHQAAHFWRRRIFDGLGLLPEERVTELKYGAYRHLRFSV